MDSITWGDAPSYRIPGLQPETQSGKIYITMQLVQHKIIITDFYLTGAAHRPFLIRDAFMKSMQFVKKMRLF